MHSTPHHHYNATESFSISPKRVPLGRSILPSFLLCMQPVSFAQPSIEQDMHGSVKARLAGNQLQLASLKVRTETVSGLKEENK